MTTPLVTAMDVLREFDRLYPLDEFIDDIHKMEGNESLREVGPLARRWLAVVEYRRALAIGAEK